MLQFLHQMFNVSVLDDAFLKCVCYRSRLVVNCWY